MSLCDHRPDILSEAITNGGASLLDLSKRQPILIVFLRHLGCTFCKEMLADLRAQRSAIEASGVGIVLVHMGTDEDARHLSARYGLDDVPRVRDPEQRLYGAFELKTGTLWQLLGPRVVARGIAATLRGHWPGPLKGNGLRLSGAFLVRDGRVVRAYRHRTAGDRPNYCDLAVEAAAAPEGE